MAANRRNLPGPFWGLSTKLIATIVVVILAVEVVIYLPSAANFRSGWLEDRLRVGLVAARVLDAAPDIMDLPQSLTDRLLMSAGATAIVYRRAGQSQLIELKDVPMPREAITVDLREGGPMGHLAGTLETLVFGGDRTLRIVGAGDSDESLVEVLMPEAPLRRDLLFYSRNIFILSLIVAVMTAAALYIIVRNILIAPIRRMTGHIVGFREAPENATLIVPPSPRRDEIGILERELAAMERDIFTMLRQRRHLADLGMAVTKINHDLRNTLTSAQMLSDQVANVDDPQVQRLAPRLVHSIDRAIGFAQQVIDYGRQSSTPPRPVPVDLRLLVEEATQEALLVGHPHIRLDNEVPDGITLRVDPDQLARVLVNLLKNAREALETENPAVAAPRVRISHTARGGEQLISIVDNGPGLPPRARDNLFVAFEGSARAGGTGLGLAIARELTEAHGGSLVYTPLDPGSQFDIVLPGAMRIV
jgi:signal transduction histidine kinase